MKKAFIRNVAIAMVVVTMSSCYGPFRLTKSLYDWNGRVSQNKFVNELVFLGLCILPAYEICTLGDALIFNSIEFWSGNNPIAMKDGEMEEREVLHKGEKYQIITSKNRMTVALKATNEKVDFQYFPEEDQWYQMDGETKVLAVTR
jgi:hypothetical protein